MASVRCLIRMIIIMLLQMVKVSGRILTIKP